MPWQYTTPISTGGMDPTTPNITQCKVDISRHDRVRGRMLLAIEYGNTVSGDWVSSFTPKDSEGKNKPTSYTVAGDEYATLWANAEPKTTQSDPSSDEYFSVDVNGTTLWIQKTGPAVKSGLYEHLESEGVIDAGSEV